MGMPGIRNSAGRQDDPKKPGDPDPARFYLQRWAMTGDMLLVELRYPDCFNYKGHKILVYEGITIADLINSKYIDPHFLEGNEHHSPIVRFEPTRRGWMMAREFCIANAKKGKA